MHTARLVSVLAVIAALGAAFWFVAGRDDGTSGTGAGAAPAVRTDLAPVVFAIIPAIDDRLVNEPCNRVPGGGLFSLGAFVSEMREHFPAVIGISLGDLTQAPGGIGRHTARHHYTEVFPQALVSYVAAGEGELALGSDYLRDVLTRIDSLQMLCANAADPGGLPILRGYLLLQSVDRNVLIVAVAAESLQAEIKARGSDVRILSASEGAIRAREAGLAQAAQLGRTVDVTVLLVHGTVDEAAALVAKVPGVTIAAAAHGPMLADVEPRKVAGVPIFYGGRGLRFAWRVLLPGDGGPPATQLVRMGQQQLAKGSTYGAEFSDFRDVSLKKYFPDVVATPGDRPTDSRGAYVGGSRCADCHQVVATQHAASSHGRPSDAILATNFAASTGCIGCHTTAPYWQGGWSGLPDRSDMAAVSCEACHGPGATHSATRSKGYGHVDFARCYDCHLPDRSPLLDADAAWKRTGHSTGKLR